MRTVITGVVQVSGRERQGGPHSTGILLSLVLLACPACTVVKIEGGSVLRYGGSLRVVPDQSAKAVSVATQNYGVVGDGRSLIVGYSASRIIMVPRVSSCAAIIFIDGGDENALSRWSEFFSEYPDVCLEGDDHG